MDRLGVGRAKTTALSEQDPAQRADNFAETRRRRLRDLLRTRPGKLIFLSLVVVTALSCQTQADVETLRSEILQLHQDFIQAHLDKDAEFLAEPTSEDYLFVANGLVEKRTAQQVEESLAKYLNSTEFSEYGDVAEPIIGFSDDGSLAWAIVQVRVAGERSDLAEDPQYFDTLWAWITLYQREGNQWRRLIDVSTNRPFADSP